MNLLVCGSRVGFTKEDVFKELDKFKDNIDVVIHGGAVGVDSFAEEWCKLNNVKSNIVRPKNVSNKIDYLFRNCVMIGRADKIIAFWDGKSKGTKFTWDYACHFSLLGYMIELEGIKDD